MGPDPRLAGLQDRSASFEPRAHIGKFGTGRDADRHNGDPGDQRDSHDFQMGASISSCERVIVHDAPPRIPLCRTTPLKGSILPPVTAGLLTNPVTLCLQTL